MAAVDANFQNWTAQDVAVYFTQKGYGEYANLWVQHRLTGDRLVMMQPGDLQAMGIAAIGDRIGIQKELRALKSHARGVERNKVLAEYRQGFQGSDIASFIYNNCGLNLCCPREADKYTLTSSTLKIRQLCSSQWLRCANIVVELARSYHINRVFGGIKCGGCLGGIWKHDTIQLDRITDVDTEITVIGVGMFAANKCWVYISSSAGVDATTQLSRVETHQLFLEKDEGEKLADEIRHRVVEYKLELSGQHDVV